MKRKLVIVLSLVALMVFTVAVLNVQADEEYWGSKKSDKYHYTSCTWAKKIKPENRRVFHSAKEARDAGYVPCKVCKPPRS
ncbi:MAG: hypothetical protein Kow0099_21330 [Candidatus Abyssubacteria bacterium]